MAERCIGFVGRIFGHKYQPRFDVRETPREADLITVGLRGFDESVHDLTTLTERTYRGDVCVRCGSSRTPTPYPPSSPERAK